MADLLCAVRKDVIRAELQLSVEIPHEALIEGPINHPAGFIVHMTLTAVDITQPVGILIGICKGLNIGGNLQLILLRQGLILCKGTDNSIATCCWE